VTELHRGLTGMERGPVVPTRYSRLSQTDIPFRLGRVGNDNVDKGDAEDDQFIRQT
jgi:hypothetical protein